ncbi:Rieske (2Fe-2S) region [Nostoc sp. NIES-4103]|nr:Rieske (2Fe-2S) region [Nostoc sp. NIES-4103]
MITAILSIHKNMESRFPFTFFPNGWFRVAYSDELPINKVQPLHYFGRDLVLFRSEDGVAHVMDAHCPHLGAHLGYGGSVKGETIQCPFHGWCFDKEGRCVDIPYTNKIPSKAQLKPWDVQEVNGLILVWYHAQKEPPTWEIPELAEYNSSEWTPFHLVGKWKIRSHIQEINENAVDTAHLQFIHQVYSAQAVAFEQNGAILRWLCHTKDKLTSDTGAIAEVINQLKFTYYGLGYVLQHFYPGAPFQPGVMFRQEFINFNFSTPIDQDYVETHQLTSFKKPVNQRYTSDLETKMLEILTIESEKDIPILENKIYRNSPLICNGDGPIMQYRRWASQFYTCQTPTKVLTTK